MAGQRVSIWIPEEHVDCIDEFCDEYSLSRSGVLSDIIGKWISEGDRPALREAVADETILLAEREHADKQMRKLQKMREKRHSWEDRVKGFFRGRVYSDQRSGDAE